MQNFIEGTRRRSVALELATRPRRAHATGLALERVWVRIAGLEPMPVSLRKHALTLASPAWDLVTAAAADAGMTAKERATLTAWVPAPNTEEKCVPLRLGPRSSRLTGSMRWSRQRKVSPDVELARFVWRCDTSATALTVSPGRRWGAPARAC